MANLRPLIISAAIFFNKLSSNHITKAFSALPETSFVHDDNFTPNFVAEHTAFPKVSSFFLFYRSDNACQNANPQLLHLPQL